MLKIPPQLPFCFLLCLCLFTPLVGQTAASNGSWIRVQGNDGDFSVEVPASHRLFHNADGFQISDGSRDMLVKNMHMLNAFANDTIVSIEIYDGDKDALDALHDHDSDKDGQKTRGIRLGELRGKEVVTRTDRYTAIRRFLSTKKRSFILTAASRNGETPTMRRFLDSFTVDVSGTADVDAVKLGTLKTEDVTIEFDEDEAKPAKPVAKPTPATPDPSVKPLIVIMAPRTSYVPAARDNGTTGRIRLRVELAKDGFVPRLIVKRSLPNGLLRQTLFAALRIKFLPKEKDGTPISVLQTFEFSFSIY